MLVTVVEINKKHLYSDTQQPYMLHLKKRYVAFCHCPYFVCLPVNNKRCNSFMT